MEILRILLDWFGGAIVSLPLVLIFMFLVDQQRFRRKWGWVVLFGLYLNAMLIIIGMPDFHYIVWDPTVNFIPFSDFTPSNLLGMVLNAALFIPFGGFLTIYFKHFHSVKKTVLAGFLMSLSIELLQLFTFRATDVDDLIMNTLGTLAGYGIAKLILRNHAGADQECHDSVKLIGMVAIVGAVTVFIRYPLVSALFNLLY